MGEDHRWLGVALPLCRFAVLWLTKLLLFFLTPKANQAEAWKRASLACNSRCSLFVSFLGGKFDASFSQLVSGLFYTKHTQKQDHF